MNLSRVSNPSKKRFQLSVGLNLETLNTILSGEPTIFEARLKFKPRLNLFKFGLLIGFFILELKSVIID